MPTSHWHEDFHLDHTYPDNIQAHATRLEQQFARLKEASKGKQLIPRQLFKALHHSYNNLCSKICMKPDAGRNTTGGAAATSLGSHDTATKAPHPAPLGPNEDNNLDIEPHTLTVSNLGRDVMHRLRPLTDLEILQEVQLSIFKAHHWFS